MDEPEQPDDQDQRVSETLDQLYEDLAEVQSHAHREDQAGKDLEQRILTLEKDLSAQRAAAAEAGERDTYNELSGQLADLQRAWQALQQDPDADPLEQYQPDDSDPGDDQPHPQEEPDAKV